MSQNGQILKILKEYLLISNLGKKKKNGIIPKDVAILLSIS